MGEKELWLVLTSPRPSNFNPEPGDPHITDEMIQAGAEAYIAWNPIEYNGAVAMDDVPEGVRDAFIAMWRSMRGAR